MDSCGAQEKRYIALGDERMILRALCEVRQTRCFEVGVGWYLDRGERGMAIKDAPFDRLRFLVWDMG